jgi:subfamily B ATP-binding cassette protein MsbA
MALYPAGWAQGRRYDIRCSTVEAADQILVVERGEIVERGSHPDLLERRGAYARMHQRQLAAT